MGYTPPCPCGAEGRRTSSGRICEFCLGHFHRLSRSGDARRFCSRSHAFAARHIGKSCEVRYRTCPCGELYVRRGNSVHCPQAIRLREKAAHRAHYLAHRQVFLDRAKRYREEHPDEYRAYQAAYREANVVYAGGDYFNRKTHPQEVIAAAELIRQTIDLLRDMGYPRGTST